MSDLTQGSVYDFNNSIMLKGDFIGFTFNGVHSSELGIIRVSEGDRYNESLLPSLSSKTIASILLLKIEFSIFLKTIKQIKR